ncbi:MAG: alpha-amylase family glycosyl hydrolase, partial [Ignavibacteriaceae bacterium]|nr:alpha-amylase family glycosyl hydrolase [Ignavibacteriaceae bacterium]
ANEGNPDYDPRKPTEEDIETLKLIAAFQMTYRGAPMLYYGDEIGMWGADDPHDRKPMIWDNLKYDNEVIGKESGFKKGLGIYTVEQNKELFSFYQKLISLRNQSDALRFGNVYFLEVGSQDVIVFGREYGDEEYLMMFNTGDNPAKLESLPYGILGYEVFTKDEINNVKDETPYLIDKKSFKIFKLYK